MMVSELEEYLDEDKENSPGAEDVRSESEITFRPYSRESDEVVRTGYHLDESVVKKLPGKNREILTKGEFRFTELVCTEETIKK